MPKRQSRDRRDRCGETYRPGEGRCSGLPAGHQAGKPALGSADGPLDPGVPAGFLDPGHSAGAGEAE